MRQRKKNPQSHSDSEAEPESNLNSETLGDEIDSVLRLLKDKKSKIKFKLLKKVSSFKLIENLGKNLDKPKSKNGFGIRKLFKKIFSYWDLLLLFTLNVIFFFYLCYSLMAYFSPKSNISIGISLMNHKALKFISETWMKFNGFSDLKHEECAIMMPDFMNAVVRPIDDCSMCGNVTSIDRRDNLSKEEFLEKYAYTGKLDA